MRKNIMVCVTQQKTCERLIFRGTELKESNDDKLYVIHVVNEKEKFLDYGSDGEALEYLFQVSKKSGADLTVLRSKNILKTLLDFARSNEVTHIIMGDSPEGEDLDRGSIRLKLQNELPNVEFVVI